MALRKNSLSNPLFNRIQVNVYEIATKQIVFTGYKVDAAKFMGVTTDNLYHALRNKGKIKNKYAVRHVKTNPPK